MKYIGVVTEFNPFHNGHKFLFEQIKNIYPDASIVCVMSGNFCQRGEIALFDKYTRAHAAVLCGADLVVSLPSCFVNLSAEGFAKASVSILKSLGITHFAFGAESDGKALIDIANYKKSDEYKKDFKKMLESNPEKPYAKIFEELILKRFGNKYKDAVRQPNNILAIEYITEIGDCRFDVIKRSQNNYKDLIPKSGIASAASVRNTFRSGMPINEYVPAEVYNLYDIQINSGFFGNIVKYKEFVSHSVISKDVEEISKYVGSPQFASKIKSAFESTASYDEAIKKAVCKSFSEARVSRATVNILLNIKYLEYMNEKPEFTALLASSKAGRLFLNSTRKTRDIAIITKPADGKKLTGNAKKQFDIDALCDRIFALSADSNCNINCFTKAKPYIGE